MLAKSSPLVDSVDFPSAADYFLNFRSWLSEASAISARNAMEYAADHSPQQIVAEFERAPGVLADAESKTDCVLRTPFGTTSVPAYLMTRVVEATVHLVDLDRALGATHAVASIASDLTARLLLELSPRQRFIDAATGRGEPDFFPVLV
jgi:hypothetical protein